MAKSKFENVVDERIAKQAPVMDSVEEEIAAMQAELGESTESTIAATPPPQPDIPTAEMLAAALVPMFSMLCPNWCVTNEECSQVAAAWGPVLDKYLPDWATKFGVEVNAVLITVLVFGPRWSTPRKIEVIQKEKTEPVNVAAT